MVLFCNERFELEGYLPDDDKHPVSVATAILSEGLSFTSEPNQEYHNSMTDHHKQKLKFIMISRFLRCHGCLLDDSHLIKIIGALVRECALENLYRDCVDFRIICIDILLSRGRMPTLHFSFLGEDLEAAKQFNSAAEVYLDIANGKLGDSEQVPKKKARGFAALAYKRDMNVC